MTRFLEFLYDTQFDDLPEAVRDEALLRLIDTLGVGAAATETQLSAIIRDHAASHFGGSTATLWWDGRRASPAGAALANGMTIDALDAHDGHPLCKGHVGCGLIPALIAISEAEGLTDGRDFLTALTLGYEIGSRAGVALHGSVPDYHTSGAWIAVAIAAVGGRVLGLSPEQTREAMGIAEYHGPRSQMMRCIDHPTMVKDGSGWGAMAGTSAVYLAQSGFTGAPAITVEDPGQAPIWESLGSDWEILNQYVKPHPVCRWAQPAAQSVMDLMAAHGLNADDVAEIHITTFHEACRLNTLPNTTEEAQYSLPFTVATALLRGTIGPRDVGANAIADPEIRARAAAITLAESDAANAAFPSRRLAEARLTLTDGTILEGPPTEARGNPDAPFSPAEQLEKFRTYAGLLGAERARALETALTDLPEAGLAPLLAALARVA